MAYVRSHSSRRAVFVLTALGIFASGCRGSATNVDLLTDMPELRECAFPVADVDTTQWTEVMALNDQFSFFVPPGYQPDTTGTILFLHGGQRWLREGRQFGEKNVDYGPGSFRNVDPDEFCQDTIHGMPALFQVASSGGRHKIWAWFRSKEAEHYAGYKPVLGGESPDRDDLAVFAGAIYSYKLRYPENCCYWMLNVTIEHVWKVGDSLEVEGIVDHGRQGSRVPGVNVFIGRSLSLRTEPPFHSVTDTEGRFEMSGPASLAKEDTLFATLVGFKIFRRPALELLHDNN